MNNFVKKLWFGALLEPKCWLYAGQDNQFLSLVVASILFAVIKRPETSVVLLALAMVYLMFIIIKPAKTFALKDKGKTLFISVFNSDFLRRHKAFPERKCAILKVWQTDNLGYDIYRTYGYDSRLVEIGYFLFKTSPAVWAMLKGCDKNSYVLGRKLGGYAFTNRTRQGKTTLCVMHGAGMFIKDVKICECKKMSIQKANYTALTPPLLKEESDCLTLNTNSGRFLMFVDEKGSKLIKYGLSAQGLPAAFLVNAPFILEKGNKEAQILETDNTGF